MILGDYLIGVAHGPNCNLDGEAVTAHGVVLEKTILQGKHRVKLSDKDTGYDYVIWKKPQSGSLAGALHARLPVPGETVTLYALNENGRPLTATGLVEGVGKGKDQICKANYSSINGTSGGMVVAMSDGKVVGRHVADGHFIRFAEIPDPAGGKPRIGLDPDTPLHSGVPASPGN
jgi:hypothetical protein